MSFLKDNWNEITKVNKDLFDVLPIKFTQDYIQSWNSADENMLIMRNFLLLLRPAVIIECGTFEARFTEMAVRTMATYYTDNQKKVITIDLPNDIDHIEETLVTFKDTPQFSEALRIRKTRLDFLKLYGKRVEVIYEEGLTQDILPGLIDKHSPTFIYEDALHIPHLLRYEWDRIKDRFKKGDIICFDDAQNSKFFDWLSKNSEGWFHTISNPDRSPQFWIEKEI